MSETETTTTEHPTETEAAAPEPPAQDGPDWKAEARKWEKLAKENKQAAVQLDELKAAHMTEQERAVADAEARGRTAAAGEYGKRLAAAEFRAATASAGVDVGALADLIDMSRFVDESGDVDTDAIAAAVEALPKPAKTGPGRSGGDFGGSPNQQPPSLAAQIADAEQRGDTRESIRLKNLSLFNQ